MTATRQESRQRVAQLRAATQRENAKWPVDTLVEIPKAAWSPGMLACDPLPSAAFRSRDFFVQLYDEPGGVIRMTVGRTSVNKAGRWVDGITWDELQTIKDAMGFADRDALEVYPAAHDIVDVANLRHLWVMPEPVTWAWRAPT